MSAERPIDIGTGSRFESEHQVTLDAIVRYAGASGDFTSIHWDADVASAADYDRFFAMGMLPAGWLGALLVHSFGPEATRSIQVRFRARTWIDQTVRCSAEVTGPGPHEGQLSVRLEAMGADGQILVDGSAVVQL